MFDGAPSTPGQPLVSIGMPVRNGADFLHETLRQLVGQTYKNIEILISDNASTDGTRDICMAFAAEDPRVTYVRQETPVSGADNFVYVFKNTRGPYYMWAAHDDRRSPDFVESMVRAAQGRAGWSMVFTDVSEFSDVAQFNPHPIRYEFASDARTPFFLKIVRLIRRSTHFYGMYRREVLARWTFPDLDFGWDMPMIAFAQTQGDFIKAEGGMFYYYRPADRSGKTASQRAKDLFYKNIAPFHMVRWCWAVVGAACYGEKLNGRRYSHLWNFLRLYVPHIWWFHLKQRLFDLAPPFAIRLWRKIKAPFESKPQTARGE